MESVSDRHSGDLGGFLTRLDPGAAIVVRVAVGELDAATPSVQHAAWMAVNLLARAKDIVSAVVLDVPAGIPIGDRVAPFGASHDLRDRLLEGGRTIGVVPVTTGQLQSRYDVLIGRGAESLGDCVLRVAGSGWWGGVARGSAPQGWKHLDADRDEPFGPYVGACLAVAEVFLSIRAPQLALDRPAAWGWNAWLRVGEAAPSDFGPNWEGLEFMDIGLAGVGAVGAAWMHTLWALPRSRGEILIADADEEGVSLSNLNRGLLFRHADVGLQKAMTAATATNGTIQWTPFDGRFELQARRPRLLVSAVDTNPARDVLQGMYLPYVLSGSTQDLRAEVMIGGEPGQGACLRCYNPLPATTSDRDLRERARRSGLGTVEALAEDLGTDSSSVIERLESGACDALSERMLERLRRQFGDAAPAQFAVGFTSAFAGVILAAETVRLVLDPNKWPTGSSERITFQFRHPAASTNRLHPYPRDPICPKCVPRLVAVKIWSARRGVPRV